MGPIFRCFWTGSHPIRIPVLPASCPHTFLFTWSGIPPFPDVVLMLGARPSQAPQQTNPLLFHLKRLCCQNAPWCPRIPLFRRTQANGHRRFSARRPSSYLPWRIRIRVYRPYFCPSPSDRISLYSSPPWRRSFQTPPAPPCFPPVGA